MELLSIRRRRALAQRGHKLLGDKRDALIMEFFTLLRRRDEVREEVIESYKRARESIFQAEALLGPLELERAITSAEELPRIPMGFVNIMGVKTPRVSVEVLPDEVKYRWGPSPSLDEVARRFLSLSKSLLKLAEVEASIHRLAIEIEKTKRRVNALEHIFIPRMEAAERYITMALEEREREDFFRRKRIKTLLERRVEGE